jgi:RHS repeat-associated protein
MLHQTEGVSNPWKFAGGFLDSSTGLYKFGTRYDDPTLGRWTQQDPVAGSLGNLNTANRYTYAGDDPINEVDPSGKDATTNLILCVVGFVAALASILYGVLEAAAGVGALSSAAAAGESLLPVILEFAAPAVLSLIIGFAAYITVVLTVCAVQQA